ncbi:LysM peptidoglycan-binding domain-containing protein [Paenibacillus sp. FA6]|uniref:LysM peptidoglycan-binding domain-containing protein n=1 Tax=Paenibacillus sp. FA6 TaxID=3413029 RepID=UPI003F659BC6
MKSMVPRSFVKISIWMFLLIIIGSSGMLHAIANSAGEERVEKNVIVLYGDTLWSIAVQEKPTNVDTRVYIKKLKQLNGLTSGNIMAGEVLKLPVN